MSVAQDREMAAEKSPIIVEAMLPTIDKSFRPDIIVERPSAGVSFRTGILIWLTLQNSVHTLLLRYVRARDVEDMFLSSVAVFFTELVKFFICVFAVCYEERGYTNCMSGIIKQVVMQPFDTLKVCVPAIIYTVQNNLFYLAASHLDAAAFMITSQLKIFSTAMFAVCMLGKPLGRSQWFALFMLFIGVSLVQLQQNDAAAKSKGIREMKPWLGLGAVVAASTLSGFAGIYFEKILKGSAPVSVWMRNIQLSVFAIPASFIASIGQDGAFIKEHGYLFGFDYLVWTMVFWYGIGGLSVAVCIKYADNIAKNFATSVAIIISTLASIYIFDFAPTTVFTVGATLVIASIFLYSAPVSPSDKR